MESRRIAGKPLAATCGMALLFGTSFVASKIALGSFSPMELVFLRFAVASAFFLLLGLWRPPAKVSRSQARSIVLLALLEPGLYFFLESYGLKLTLASTAAVLISTIPLFVVLWEVLFLGLRVRADELGLVLLSLLGVGLLLTAGSWRQALGGTLAGNLLVLGAAISASVYTLVARRLMAAVDALTVTRAQALFAALFYAPFAAGAFASHQRLPTDPVPWLAVAYLGLFCSFGAYFLLNYALAHLRASLVAAFSNLIPVVATALAVLLLGEGLSAQQLLGAGITVAAITALTLRHRPPESTPPAAG
jgi:drug/metabolite transporter (DMT)-like permease